MPYASGEMPMIGDRIKDNQGRQAKVIDLEGSGIRVRWNEGVVGIEYPSDEFFLVEGAEQKPSPEAFQAKATDAGSRFAQRRSAPRFAFVAPLEMTDPITKSHIAGRVSEISQHGCFAEAENLLTVDSVVQLRVHKNGDVFETWARVVHSRSGIGMGLHFIDTASKQKTLLKGWLEGLKEG